MKKLLAFWVVIFLGVSGVVFAETTPPSNTKPLATVNIEDGKIVSQNKNNFEISFNLSNGENVQAGVHYGIKLIKETDKGQFLVDEKVYQEVLSLSSNSVISKKISYEASPYLSGEYTLLLFAKDNSGFPFGIAFIDKVKLEASKKGVYIMPETCYLFLPLSSQLADSKYSLLQGVDISKEEDLAISCEFVNNTDAEMRLVPVAKIKSQTDEKEREIILGNPVLFKKDKNELTIFNINKETKTPQAYDTKIYFKNDSYTTNEILTHYVVAGLSGTIRNLSIDKDYYKKGENMLLTFMVSGRADGFSGSRLGNETTKDSQISLIAEVKNNKGKSCTDNFTRDLLPVEIGSKIELPLLITSKCLSPEVTLTIKNKDTSETLDSKVFKIETKNPPKSNNSVYILIVVLILIIASVFLITKKKQLKMTNTTLVSIVFLFSFILLFLPSVVRADSFSSFGNDYVINMKKTMSPGEVFTVNAQVTVTACSNATVSETLTGEKYNDDGIKVKIIDGKTTGGGTLYGKADFTAPTTPGDYAIYFTGNNGLGYIFYHVSGKVDGVCSTNGCSSGSMVTWSNGQWDCKGNDGGAIVTCGTANNTSNNNTGNNTNNGEWTGSTPVCGKSPKTCIVGDVYSGYNNTWECWTDDGPKIKHVTCSIPENSIYGTLKVIPDPCEIKENQSECDAVITWTTTNAKVDSEIKIGNNVISKGINGSINYKIPFSYSTNKFSLWNSGKEINSVNVASTCGDSGVFDEKLKVCIKKDGYPSTPILTGKTKVKMGSYETYGAVSTDKESGLMYGIKWNDGNLSILPGTSNHIVNYASSGEVVNFSRMFNKLGKYFVEVYAEDKDGNKSNKASLSVEVVDEVGPTGILSANSCKIKENESSCNINFSWEIIDPVPSAETAVTKPTNIKIGSGNKGQSSVSLHYKDSPLKLFLSHNTKPITETSVTATCDIGLTWNGTKCVKGGNGGDGDDTKKCPNGATDFPTCTPPCVDTTSVACKDCLLKNPTNQSICYPVVPPKNDLNADLQANPTAIRSGQVTKLTWTSTEGSVCVINTEKGKPITSGINAGSIDDKPTETTVYVLTCQKDNLTGTDKEEVKVGRKWDWIEI